MTTPIRRLLAGAAITAFAVAGGAGIAAADTPAAPPTTTTDNAQHQDGGSDNSPGGDQGDATATQEQTYDCPFYNPWCP